MANLNKVLLIGNLTRDPDIKYTAKGSAVAEFGLAVNRPYTTDQGEKREDVIFIDITVWGRTAELAGQYLTKGRSVFIEGRLHLSSWDDKQTGLKRTKISVVGEILQFLGPRSESGTSHPPSSAPSPPTSMRTTKVATEDDDEEIPF